MASLEELEQESQAKSCEVVQGEVEVQDDEDMLREDLYDAMSIMSKSMHLLDYLADEDLCRTITKRERASMSRLSEQLRKFLDNLEAAWDEGEWE